MFKRTRTLLYAILTLILVTSCEEKSSPLFDEQNFTKIYANNQFSASNYPIDIQQTDDGGYLILGGRKLDNSNFRGIYLMKADKYGNFVKDMEVDETFVNAVGALTKQEGKYYFFCMDGSTETYLAEVDQDLSSEIQTTQIGLSYPAAASFVNGQFVLLSYNDTDKESVISLVSTTGTSSSSKSFSIGIGEDIEEPIIKHFIHTGKQLPFFTGQVSGGLYYFNGFYNYTLSLVFTDLTQDDPVGVVQGQEDNGGFSAATSLGSAKFAAARFNFGDNYIMPNASLATSGNTSSVDLGGNTFPELVPDAPVKILRVIANKKNVLIYASDTRSKQIGLFFYDEPTGEFISSRYLGFSNPFEIASLIQTADEGLIVCGTTYVAGRFPRICLFKLSKGELEKIANH